MRLALRTLVPLSNASALSSNVLSPAMQTLRAGQSSQHGPGLMVPSPIRTIPAASFSRCWIRSFSEASSQYTFAIPRRKAWLTASRIGFLIFRRAR